MNAQLIQVVRHWDSWYKRVVELGGITRRDGQVFTANIKGSIIGKWDCAKHRGFIL